MAVSGRLSVSRQSLNLKLMLEGGQCFRWSKSSENQWTGVASKIMWVLTQHDDHVQYTAKSRGKISASSCQQFLTKYLRLDEDLECLYEQWSKADTHFAKVSEKNTGLRVLDQDPIENLFSFICSSNNNIVRISSMVEKMCKLYGETVVEEKGVTYFAFPPLKRLADEGVEEALRTAGFGYRAKYIHKSAERLMALGGEKWLAKLTEVPYEEAKQQLMQLDGVGPKVADCICLMSLGHLCAVPVDTHVFQIAAEHYLPHLKTSKTCTTKIYNDITKHFIELYGPYAGWAHTILFCADLKMFKEQNGKAPNQKKSSKKPPSKSSSIEVLIKENGVEIDTSRKRPRNEVIENSPALGHCALDENISPSSGKIKARKVCTSTDNALNGLLKNPAEGRLPRACKK